MPVQARLAPEIALPPYGFVPGLLPHPHRSPQGHSHGLRGDIFGAPPDPDGWQRCLPYLHVLDLFNFGYYWESHEGLELWWKALPQTDVRRAFFQGVLHIAAAGVKARLGHAPGIHSHCIKGAKLLEETARRLEAAHPGLVGADPRLLGLYPRRIAAAADQIALRAHSFQPASPLPAVDAVLPLKLEPDGLDRSAR